MKQVMVAILLVASMGAQAEWIPLGKSSGGCDLYGAPQTGRLTQQGMRVWFLDNCSNREVNGVVYKSSMSLMEFDCIGERERALSQKAYSGPMGTGRVIYSREGAPSEWDYAVPGSVGEHYLKTVCSVFHTHGLRSKRK